MDVNCTLTGWRRHKFKVRGGSSSLWPAVIQQKGLKGNLII